MRAAAAPSAPGRCPGQVLPRLVWASIRRVHRGDQPHLRQLRQDPLGTSLQGGATKASSETPNASADRVVLRARALHTPARSVWHGRVAPLQGAAAPTRTRPAQCLRKTKSCSDSPATRVRRPPYTKGCTAAAPSSCGTSRQTAAITRVIAEEATRRDVRGATRAYPTACRRTRPGRGGAAPIRARKASPHRRCTALPTG